MAVTTIFTQNEFEEVVNKTHTAVETELKRSRKEKEAFRKFESQVQEIFTYKNSFRGGFSQSSCNVSVRDVRLSNTLQQPESTINQNIREAFEETVMDLPFFDHCYGESYEEFIRNEFGPEVATVLFNRNCMVPSTPKVLSARIKEAKEQREMTIQRCEREQNSIIEFTEDLEPLYEETKSYGELSFQKEDFGTLEANRNYVDELKQECERVAVDRQSHISKSVSHNTTENSYYAQEYIYSDLEFDFPILFICARIIAKLDSIQERLESELINSLQ